MRRSTWWRAAVVPCLFVVLSGCSPDHEQVTGPQTTPVVPPLSPLMLGNFSDLVFLDFTLDDGGPNDNPAQSDLNSFTRADNLSGFLGVAFTWDDINSWTGSGQTGDACALFDIDQPANGSADYALCVRITNNPDGSEVFQLNPGSPVLYGCSDKKTDRCSQPVTASLPLGNTMCTVEKYAEAFPAQGDDGEDVLAVCKIDLSAIQGASNSNILNVCSFPSGSPNSNPFDCVVTPGAGFIQIVKKTSPDQSGHTFSFTLNPASTGGATLFTLTDDGAGDETSALIPVSPGNYSLTEGALPTGWALDQASCVREGTSTGTKSGTAITGIGVTIGETTVCTFENKLGAPSVTVLKTADPTSILETGGDVEYTVEVTNNSAVDVTLSTLSDDKFGDLNGKGDCATGGAIAAGATYNCSFTETLPAASDGDTHTNTVTATVTNDGGQANDDDDATVTYADVAPTLEVTKTADPTSRPETGGSVTYTVTVENTSAEPVTLTTLVDDQFGDLDGQGDCATGGTINAGVTYTCSFSKTVSGNAGTSHVNEVTATIQDDDGTDASASDDATVTFTDVEPSISVTKTANPTQLSSSGAGILTFPDPDVIFTSDGGDPAGDGDPVYASKVCDDAGPNDVPAQVDLNCFDRADNIPGELHIKLTWDDINSWSGNGQTGDACGLLDTDNDGKANFSICARITNDPGTGAIVQVPSAGWADVYQCNDTKSDRCGQPISLLPQSSIGTTSCTIDGNAAESFPNQGDDGADVEAECLIDLTGIAGLPGDPTLIDLLNVCSYPSGSPNSNPFDCVVTAGAGFVRIVKVTNVTSTTHSGFTLSPAATNGWAKIEMGGAVAGFSSGLIPVAPGNNYSLTETLASGWTLANISCATDATPTGTMNLGQLKITGVQVKTGQTTVCTFTNELIISGDVEYTITVTNNSLEDVSLFSLMDDKFGDLNGVGTCGTGGTIVNGTPYQCKFTKTLSGAPGTQHVNEVTAVGKDDEDQSDTKKASATVSFVNAP